MKELRFRLIVIVAAVALSIYLLWPTYQDYQNNKVVKQYLEHVQDSLMQANPKISKEKLDNILLAKEDSIHSNNKAFQKAREKRIKLGLDLQGGMYLVLEVNTAKLLERLAKEPDATFKQIMKEANNEAKLSDEDLVSIVVRKLQERGIRLSRYFGTIRQSDNEIIKRLRQQESDAVTRAIQIIRNRVDQYGVSEPSIQQQGSRRIVVELPGVSKEEEAKRLLQGRALLEFKLVKDADFAIPIMNKIDNVLAKSLSKDTTQVDTSKTDSTQQMTREEFAKKHPFYSIAIVNPRSQYPDAFVKAEDRAKVMKYLNRPDVKNVIPDNVQFLFSAKPIITQNGIQYYKLYMLNKKAELTGGVITDARANIDPQTTSPVVNMTMNSEGAREWARITGANIKKRCAIVLDGYVYSAPVIQNKIPSGRSQISGIGNMDEAKLLEIVLKAGALPAPVDIIEERTVGPSLGEDSISKGFNSTFIGFIIVAIFMLLYYRRAGTLADLALLFTILFIMGVLAAFHATLTLPGIAGIILTIGMAVDANVIIFERIREEMDTGKTMRASVESGFKNSYSAIFDANITTFFTGIILYQFGSGPVQGFALTLMIGIISSLFAALVITKVLFEYMLYKGMKINVGARKHPFRNVNFNFLGNRKIAYLISGSLFTIGVLSIIFRGLSYGIDFKGGSEIALQFDKPIVISQVRQKVSKIGLGKVEVKTFGGESGILLRTELQNIPKKVYPKVLKAIDTKMKEIMPNVHYTIVDSTVNSVTYKFDNPKITNEITDKLFNAGFQTSKVTQAANNKEMIVRVGISDWIEQSLEKEFPNNHFKLLKEDKVGPKIGKELKVDAIIAIVLALIVILIYLGFRFKFVFASGAVVALFHDVTITLGLFSLLYGWVKFLNLDINIDVVAAFLTLVGYSINDTVVVFDRIREDIKIHKTAPLEENMNKAINKTLSRTIITSLTTLFVVAVLLFFGGDVLRGFAFTLFFGIIIGTYSSVFIASPFVLEYVKKRKMKIQF